MQEFVSDAILKRKNSISTSSSFPPQLLFHQDKTFITISTDAECLATARSRCQGLEWFQQQYLGLILALSLLVFADTKQVAKERLQGQFGNGFSRSVRMWSSWGELYQHVNLPTHSTRACPQFGITLMGIFPCLMYRKKGVILSW